MYKTLSKHKKDLVGAVEKLLILFFFLTPVMAPMYHPGEPIRVFLLLGSPLGLALSVHCFMRAKHSISKIILSVTALWFGFFTAMIITN